MKKIIVYVALMISSLVFSQNAFDKLDTTLQNLKSYTDEGRKYLYTETK